jgi:tetratricopeptide (TPR) repeat protein
LLSAVFLLFLAVDANQAKALLQRGLIALQHGQLSEARTDLEGASHADPGNPYVWTSLAQTYLRLDESGKAESAASKAEQLGGTNPVVVHALGIFSFEYAQMLLHREDFTKAANVLSAALQGNPGNAQLTLALGVARYGQRRFDDAIEEFLKVIQIDPSIDQSYAFLGRMLDQAGTRLPEITADYEAWAKSSPQNAKAQLLLAEALLTSDEHSQRAEELLRRSVALDPKSWQSHYQLGVLLANKHDYRAAAAELARSIELDPKQAVVHYHLARVYDRLGEVEQAKAEREIHRQLTAQPNSRPQ